MKVFLIILSVFFISINTSFGNYKLENWSQILIEKYNISIKNLENPISRKEFIEILYNWYIDYKKDKWIIINYTNYTPLDNSKIFVDINLNSDFWKKLSYFTHIWIFSKNEYFNPNWIINQNTYFAIMNRLKIMYWLENCKSLKICEKECDENTPFVKWTYLKYTSKILDKSLRKYYFSPNEYINAWYKPYLKTNYNFPVTQQSLNWCYAFSIRNILKYKHWIWIYISKVEELIWKNPWSLWTYNSMSEFNKLVHIEANKYYNIDTLINSLQVWEPIAVSYMLKYYSYKDKKYNYVPHIVAAYSFDEKWVWIAETVTNKRLRINWDELFMKNWWVKLNRIFKYNYLPKYTWSEKEIDFENKNNVLVKEF